MGRSHSAIVRFSALCLGFACALPGPARSLPEAAAVRGAVLAPQGALVKDWTMTSGALTVHVDEGQATYLLAKGQRVGLYVKGTGSFRFLAADPVMKPTLLFNLAENTKLVPKAEGAAIALGEPITEAVFWFSGVELPPIGTADQTAPAAAYAATATLFAERDTVRALHATEVLGRPPVDQLLAYRSLNGLKEPVLTADLVGAAESYVYTYDPAFSRLESLFIQRPLYLHGAGQSIVLAANPIGWTPNAPPDPDFRLTHLQVDLEAAQGMHGKLTAVETIQALRPGLRCLAFHFTDLRRAQDALGNPVLARTFIRHIRTMDGKDVDFSLGGGYLQVDLGHAAAKGETFKLAFEIDGAFLENDGSKKFSFWRLPPGWHWFPEPDLAGQGYTVEATIAVEKPYVAIASARTVSRSETPTQNILKAALDKPTIWFSVAGGLYEPVELVRNNRTVRAWCYGGVPSTAEQLLKTVHGILEFYDGIFGGVPFDEINLVENPHMGAGQAPPGMIWLTREAFNPTEDLMTRRVAAGHGTTDPRTRRLGSEYVAAGGWANRMIAHELAHQYWGHRVKPYAHADNWLSEGFAEYTASLALRAMKKKGPMVYDDIVADWQERASKASGMGTIPTVHFMQPHFADQMGDRDSTHYPKAILYYKSAYLLACLNKELGDEAFLRFLRGYQKRFAWYPPSISQDVTDLLKAASGRDYTQWMKENFWGTGMPVLPK